MEHGKRVCVGDCAGMEPSRPECLCVCVKKKGVNTPKHKGVVRVPVLLHYYAAVSPIGYTFQSMHTIKCRPHCGSVLESS